MMSASNSIRQRTNRSHRRHRVGRAYQGVTLIEVMMVVTIMGILMAMIAPRFGSMRVRWQVEGAGQQLVRDLNRARTEAVKRNTSFWLAKKSATEYEIQVPAGCPAPVEDEVGTRRCRDYGVRVLPSSVAFTAGPDTVKFAAFGPAIKGAGTFTLTLQGVVRSVNVNASGFASVR